MAVPGLSCSRQNLLCSMWDLAPWPGIKPGPPTLRAQRDVHHPLIYSFASPPCTPGSHVWSFARSCWCQISVSSTYLLISFINLCLGIDSAFFLTSSCSCLPVCHSPSLYQGFWVATGLSVRTTDPLPRESVPELLIMRLSTLSTAHRCLQSCPRPALQLTFSLCLLHTLHCSHTQLRAIPWMYLVPSSLVTLHDCTSRVSQITFSILRPIIWSLLSMLSI